MTVYLGLGSNLGDRQANILHALQKLRASVTIVAVSSYFESPAAAGARGPAFLNIAAAVETNLEPAPFEALLRRVEAAVGRRRAPHLAARPIDIDILYFGNAAGDYGSFAVPHPYLADRPFNVVPLAEIAPELIEPVSGRTIGALAKGVMAGGGIVRKTRTLHFFANRQDEEPDVKLAVDRAGVSNLKRVVRLNVAGKETAFNAELSMVADLAPHQAGVHMSRFSEVLEEAIADALAGPQHSARLEDVVTKVARTIVDSQRAMRADVRLRASFGLERWTPVSAKRGDETYDLVVVAHADRLGARRVIGVEAEGMTACPCAQLMVREHSFRELTASGFSEADANRALDSLPVATHNQRGRGSVFLGTCDELDAPINAEDLVELVENSMSSETYDLLKRPDEFFVVNKAHHNPKFVEDVVRGILARALDIYADFSDGTFVSASQVNYESIHKHDAFAEASGTFGELRAELRGQMHDGRRTDLATWLGTCPSPVVASSGSSS